jgi:hypothetical protein
VIEPHEHPAITRRLTDIERVLHLLLRIELQRQRGRASHTARATVRLEAEQLAREIEQELNR